ncbi:MAG: hypothetical protein HDR04_09320 [Lachnospiraceae bacterium]|nr:hypothetical protein [Lachnospiraceae bacterium]
MIKKCKLLFISALTMVFLFYRADSVVAMANEESGQDVESAVGSESEQNVESVVEQEAEQGIERIVELAESEQIVKTPSALNTTPDFVSNGPALIEWLESHKDIGGTVKLTDHVVLEGDYTYCPNGINRPTVFVDTDQYTITVTGEIELMSDNHLIFSGQPDGKSIFYVAPKGALSMMGVAVESGQCALWQEEGAGLVMEDCHISGNVHYAETPFVLYQNTVYVVVEKEQTVNDVLPTEISCTVNRQGQLSHNEPVPLSWNLEGSDDQQTERRRFQLQGSFLQAASAEPALCTVAYNDYPLTFLEVTATDDGTRYTFRGGYTKPEEALPITVISEYSFDGENWIVYDETNVKDVEAGFFIGFRSEECDRTAYSNIYIRLQWNDSGTRYFSNVLCYAADNLENVEDIGGSRGGGTSIINLPEDPQEKSGDTKADEGANQNADRNGGSEAANDGQPSNAESRNNNEDQPLHAESINAGQSSYSESKTDTTVTDANDADNIESINRSDSDISEKEAVAAISVKGENGTNLPRMNEQTLRSDIRTGNAIFIAIGFVLLSVIAGIAGFCVHSRFGTNR